MNQAFNNDISIIHLDEIPSTNDYLSQLCRQENVPEFQVVTAMSQERTTRQFMGIRKRQEPIVQFGPPPYFHRGKGTILPVYANRYLCIRIT